MGPQKKRRADGSRGPWDQIGLFPHPRHSVLQEGNITAMEWEKRSLSITNDIERGADGREKGR